MPDILKVTTPLVNGNQAVSAKQKLDAATPFSIQDTAKVIQTHNQSELLRQNTNTLESGDAPTLLLSLLRDPAVSVAYLKNICLLEEIFKLVPANNRTVTQEIEQLFHELLLPPGELAAEMERQEHGATLFRGGLFDVLRGIGEQGRDQPNLQLAIAALLKAIQQSGNRGGVVKAVVNNLTYLQGALPARDPARRTLDALLPRLLAEDAPYRLPALKQEVLALTKEISNSIFCTPKLEKVLSIMKYNLSRYNDNAAFLDDAAFRLRQLLPPAQREAFLQAFAQFLAAGPPQSSPPESKVMDALVRLIAKQVGQNTESVSDAARTEKILHSLLSSPCNFTPLLHYILPAFCGETRAFAEVWIHAGNGESDARSGADDAVHFLLVIDAASAGRFEAEFFVRGQTIDFALYCPPGQEPAYQPLVQAFPAMLARTPYRAGHTHVGTLRQTRSLMDVFKSLPYKRVGVDVKI